MPEATDFGRQRHRARVRFSTGHRRAAAGGRWAWLCSLRGQRCADGLDDQIVQGAYPRVAADLAVHRQAHSGLEGFDGPLGVLTEVTVRGQQVGAVVTLFPVVEAALAFAYRRGVVEA